MSTPRKPLSSRVPWSRLASELGIHIRTVGLPAATPCPFCQGVMRVCRDPLLEGQWFHCPSCKRQGDMIELAAAVWELEIPETIARLKRLGFGVPDSDDGVCAYLREHVEYRRRLHCLWEAGRTRLDESRALLRLSHQLGTMCEVSEERRVDGPAVILRGSNAVTVERCFAPGAMQHADAKPQRCNPSERAVFRGGGWDEVLLVPYYDLPWRICGFAFVGRSADPSQDIVFKRANLGPPRALGAEAGLALHPRVLEAAEQWDDTIIAMGDLITAWRLQMRHLEHSLRPLPIAAWHDSRDYPSWHAASYLVRTRNAWEMLGGRKIVFWMPKATVATFQQAIHTDGEISTVGPREPDEHSLKEYCWKYTSEELAKHVLARARPWPEVLSQHLDTLSGPAVEEFLAQLELGGVRLDELVKQLSNGTRLRIARVRSAAETPLSIDFDGRTIIEQDNQWHAINRKGPPELIMNAVLRIDAIVCLADSDDVYYAGRVCHEGDEVAFCVPEETIEKHPFNWLKKLLIRRLAKPLTFGPCWSRHLVRIAQQFQQPEVIQGADRVGYDSERSRIVFPSFTIEERGQVNKLAYSVFPDPVPAKELDEPEVLSPEELSRPALRCGQGGAEVFWGLTACVLANVLAPAFNCRTYGIALVGHVAGEVGQALARAIGCVEYRPRTAAQASESLRAEQQHGWPIVLEVSSLLQRRYRRLLFEPGNDKPRNCIASVDPVAAKLLAIRGGWHTITTQHEGGIAADTLAVAKMLVPAYLKDISERRFDLGVYPDTAASLLNLILQDLARYVKVRYGEEEDVLSAGRVVMLDDAAHRAEAFADLLIQFVEHHRLEIRPTAETRRKAGLLEVEPDGLLIPHATLEKLTNQSSAPVPAIEHLYRVLDEANVLVDEHDDGPVFRREWFDERRRFSRATRSGLLKIH